MLSKAMFPSGLLLLGVHPVVLRKSADAAGELHHTSSQTDREPAAAAGQRGQDTVLHGPCHQLLPCGQGHGQDHQGGVRCLAVSVDVWMVERMCDDSLCVCDCVSGRQADWMSILPV